MTETLGAWLLQVNGQNGLHGLNGDSYLRLTFHDGNFVLQVDEGHAWDSELLSKWQSHAAQDFGFMFSTKNIKHAACFREYADSRAEKVFQRHTLQTVAPPPGGVLSPKGMKLYPFQRDRGVPHILSHNKSYLAHQPGLGKSAQAICAIGSKPGKALFIVPSFLKINWAREITNWFVRDFPEIAILPETKSKHKMNWAADFVIVSDSMLQREWVGVELASREFRYVFVDEAHRFKTQDATRTTALFGGRNGTVRSPGFVYKAEHSCLMSGTPLLSRPIELWPALYAMAPELIDFMSYQSFGFKYGGAVRDDHGGWRFVGSANEEDLRDRIMGKFMQVIKKKDVLKDLPDKVREVLIVDEDTRHHDTKILDAKLLRELRDSDFEKPKSLGTYAVVRHENGMAKVNWAYNFIHNAMSSGIEEQIIVFAHHKDVVASLAAALHSWNPMVINGETPNAHRTKIEDLFQSGKRRLIIGNIQAMNLGITLTKASRVLFVEYDWTPAINEQAEDRAHRIGQKDSVLCQYIVLPGTIDEAILTSVLRKQESIKKVMG